MNRQLFAAGAGQKFAQGLFPVLFIIRLHFLSSSSFADTAVAPEVTGLVMLSSAQVNMPTLFGWLIILAQLAVFLGIFFKLIVLTYNPSNWYSIHDHTSAWQSLRDFVQFFQLGLVGFFLLIPEAELDRLTIRWTFLSLTFLLIAGQMAESDQRSGQFSLTSYSGYGFDLADSDSILTCVILSDWSSSALGPGSPARQGARDV